MKKIVGFIGAVGHELDRFGSQAPEIGQGGSVAWGSQRVSGFERVESVEAGASHAHLFSEWDESLEGFGSAARSDGTRRWICTARPGTGVEWLEARMASGFDALAGVDEKLVDASVPWYALEVAESDKFLFIKMGGHERLVHTRNVMSILAKQHASLEGMVGSDPSWIFGRVSIEIEGALIPVVNATKQSWLNDWNEGRSVGGAIVMPYRLDSGSLVSWCALLKDAPRMMGARAIDEMESEGVALDFANEKDLLALSLN